MKNPPALDHSEDHHHGLAHDLRVLASMKDRRQALRLLAGASLVPMFACATTDSVVDDAGNVLSPDAGTTAGTCATIPDETGGPYPGDGSNGPNALALGGIVRNDIRSSLAPASGTAEGVPLTVKLTLVNTGGACAPLAGYAVYLWHCDRDGQYSMYNITDQNYLRGVQESDGSGVLTFTTVFPGCYAGRWPHIHFEVYRSAAQAMAGGAKVKTSQLALPEDICKTVYASAGYSQSVANLAQTSLARDNVFSDGVSRQLAETTGSVAAGYVAALTVGVPA
jgi:protocatechuate 3,4-dioxygenase beta subunit